MQKKDYADINIKEIAQTAHVGRRTVYRYFHHKDDIMKYVAKSLMDSFAQKINEMKAENVAEIAVAYFSFWEEHIETLLLLYKSHLTYFIEDCLPELIMRVALQTKFAGKNIDLSKAFDKASDLEMYYFYFVLAGYWKLTLVWIQENPRKTPQEMSRMIFQIMKNGNT